MLPVINFIPLFSEPQLSITILLTVNLIAVIFCLRSLSLSNKPSLLNHFTSPTFFSMLTPSLFICVTFPLFCRSLSSILSWTCCQETGFSTYCECTKGVHDHQRWGSRDQRERESLDGQGEQKIKK